MHMATRTSKARAARPAGTEGAGRYARFRPKAVRLLRVAMEAVVLLMVCLSPWAFGAVEPMFEFCLYAGVAVLLVLWGTRMLLEVRLTWQKCPVALCLAALFLCGAWQLAPLPRPLLARLSPGTAQVYDQLLPSEPEVLPWGEKLAAAAPPAGSTISLYPAATRQQLVRLLAIFLLFAVVRNNFASVGALRRLAVAALVNGALLALLGLVQFFTSPPTTVYWTFPSPGTVFGPFICRNHFPFYINLCLGLGLGLLVGLGRGRGDAARSVGDGESWFRSPLSLLHEKPQALWISLGLALMLSGVALSLSRGGLLALVGASLLCLLIALRRLPRFSGLRIALVPLLVALGVVIWLGTDQVEARFANLWKGETSPGSRAALWARSVRLVEDFPLWGTGYGTFSYVEPLNRSSAADDGLIYDHAHNDYLEALVEGGLLRLALGLLALGFAFWLGYRALRRHLGDPAGGLVLGALFGLSTLAIHSFVDFGLHIPAVAVLAAVVCAHLCALGGSRGGAGTAVEPGQQNDDPGAYSFRLWGLAGVLGATTAVAIGLGLCGAGWRAVSVQRYWFAALRLRGASESDRRERQILYLETAARLAPDHARLRIDAGQVHSDLYDAGVTSLLDQRRLNDAVQAVTAWAGGPTPWAPAVSWLAASAAGERLARSKEEQLMRKHLVPALHHYLQARDSCPLLVRPHAWLAAHADRLDRSEPRGAYLERAKFLAPSDPEVWYLCGVQDLLEGRQDQAWESWRRSLELSDRHLPEILTVGARSLGPGDVLALVLPDNPTLLRAAAFQLYPQPEAATQRRPFLEKVLLLLKEQPRPPSAADLRLRALVHGDLGQPAEALTAYESALAREPLQVGWRYEFARLLYQQGRLQDARRELLTVLGQQPGHTQALELLEAVTRDLANGG